jgi:PleD family two-component response regulator
MFAQHARTLPAIEPSPALSVGVASLHRHEPKDAEALLRMADEAMYMAKRSRLGVAMSAGDTGGVPPTEHR